MVLCPDVCVDVSFILAVVTVGTEQHGAGVRPGGRGLD